MHEENTESKIEQPEELEHTDTDISAEEEQGPMTRSQLLRALKNGIENGVLTKQQARQIKFENGITQSTFTKKRMSADKRRQKRKQQKAARKVTRQQGFKGQKMTKGNGISANY